MKKKGLWSRFMWAATTMILNVFNTVGDSFFSSFVCASLKWHLLHRFASLWTYAAANTPCVILLIFFWLFGSFLFV